MSRNISLFFAISFLLLFCFIKPTYSQTQHDIQERLKRNSFHLTLGYFLVYGAGIVGFEHILHQNPENSNLTFFSWTGVGLSNDYGLEKWFVLTRLGLLTGRKKHHIECSLGPAYMVDRGYRDDREIQISGTLGWRIQKPEGGFIFRLGIGYPETAYVGVGGAF